MAIAPSTKEMVLVFDALSLKRESNRAEAKAETKSRGRPKANENSKRVHMILPEALSERIQEIQKDTYAASVTEVVKNALVLYAAAFEEHKNGGELIFRRGPGEVERKIAIFI